MKGAFPLATGETLRQLVASHQLRNDEAFRAAVLRLIAEEHQLRHSSVARELERLLAIETERHPGTEVSHQFQELPRDRERKTLLLEVRQPQRFFGDVILDDETQSAIEEIIDEYRHEEALLAYGLKPKRKILFFGPPGCGKTVCAEVLATELGLPMLYTRLDGLVSSFLGETAANLRRIFDYAARGRWVLFFDEFDAVGKSRDEAGESGELKRVINSFLQLLDSFHADSYFVAATNHETMLDTALWRRFDDVIYFGLPTEQQVYELIKSRLRNFPHPKLNMRVFAHALNGLSYADIEHICTEAIKRCILDGKKSLDSATFDRMILRHRRRIKQIELRTGAPDDSVGL